MSENLSVLYRYFSNFQVSKVSKAAEKHLVSYFVIIDNFRTYQKTRFEQNFDISKFIFLYFGAGGFNHKIFDSKNQIY